MTAQWFGTVPAVVLGGVGTLVVIAAWAWLFPELRHAGELTAIRSDELQAPTAIQPPGKDQASNPHAESLARLRPHAVECPLSFRHQGSRIARTLLPSRRKSDHRAPRISRRPDDVHHDGVYRRGEPADAGPSGHADRRRRFRHLHRRGRCHSGHGTLRQLSHRAGPRHVAQRLFHLRGLSGDACSLAHGARGYLFFRRLLPGSYRDPRSGANRQRHSRVSEVFDCRRHRDVHRVRGTAQRQSRGCESGNVRQPGKFRQSRSSTGLRRVWRSCWF